MSKSKQWHCQRCGHDWDSVNGEKPKACAKCVSHYWDTPKRVFKRDKAPDTKVTREDAVGLLPPPRLR